MSYLIKESKMLAGIAIDDSTHAKSLMPFLESGAFDFVTVYSAEEGQSFYESIEWLRQNYPSLNIQVSAKDTEKASKSGANVFLTTLAADASETENIASVEDLKLAV